VTYQPPLTPTNLAPAAGALNLVTAPTLQATAFVDPNSGGTQSASEWAVQRVSDSAVVFDSGTDGVDTTSITLPANALDYDTSYSWQARYADNFGSWSSYSAATTFTTVAPGISYGFQMGGVILSWPTNTTGFVLEYSTDLTANNWQPVLSTPAVAGNNFVITNFPASGNVFFRLSKP
jgi:hypothetical protein